MVDPDDLLTAAFRAWQAGLCVVPAKEDGSKRPDLPAWRDFQHRRPTEEEVRQWFSRPRHGIGIITGEPSGNLEMLEFEGRAVELGIWDSFKEAAAEMGLLPLLARVMRGYGERSPAGGIHLFWRCMQIEGNLALAKTEDQERLIETRGQGGFVVVAPSNGATHPSGRPYELLAGGFESIEDILIPEREALLDLARTFDQTPREVDREAVPPGGEDQGRPGDDFNARGDWEQDVLGPAGWKLTGIHGGRQLWYRSREGGRGWISATISPDGECLYCFSTATPLPAERGLSKFATYAYLHHGGNFSEAARELKQRGFGSPDDGGEIRGESSFLVSPLYREKRETRNESGFPLISATQLLAEDLNEPPDLVEGLLPWGGLSILGAKPKAGKSTLARCLALAVAQGREFLGRAVKQGCVILLCLEEKRSEVRNHLQQIGAGAGEDLLLFFGSTPKDGLLRLAEVIWERRPVLVIIDPLFRFTRIRDANAYAEVTNALGPVLQVARDTSCHLLLVHHNSKIVRGGGDDLLGSTAIFGAVDTAVMLVRRTDGLRYAYSVQRYGQDLEQTVLRLDEGHVLMAGELSKFEIEKLKEDVLVFLRNEGQAAEAAIREVVSGNTGHIGKALRALVEEHRVKRSGAGKRGDPFMYSVEG